MPKFTIAFNNNKLTRKGRPDFISSVKKNMPVNKGQDRRHIIHGSTMISDLLIVCFNKIIENKGIQKLEEIIDRILLEFREQNIKFRLDKNPSLIDKVKKVITIAFSRQSNLIIGSAIYNQAIEKARSSIKSTKDKLNKYCSFDIRNLSEIKNFIKKSITISKSNGEIAKHRRYIMLVLWQSISKATSTLNVIQILNDFEFTCSLDIIHDGTRKKDNIKGLKIANILYRAKCLKDYNIILTILT